MDNVFDSMDFENDIVSGLVEEDEKVEVEVEIVDSSAIEEDTDVLAPVVAPKPTAPVVNMDFNFDFGSLGLAGVIQGDIGLEVSRYPVDKLKFTTQAKTLISIVTSRVIAVKTHYIEGLGSIICTGKSCCQQDGAPRIKYVFPCVVYDTDKKGRPLSKKLEFKALAVGAETYESIMTKHELQGDISNVDLLVTCLDENYQKIQLDVAGDTRWKKNQVMVKEVMEFWGEHMKDLLKAIARQVTDKEIRTALNGDEGPVDADIDMNDVFAD